MKKKFLIFTMLTLCVLALTACGKTKIDLNDYLIEERNNLFTAQDSLYTVTLSSGLRENNYNYDGVIDEKVDFGVLTLMRNDANPLANDTYSYKITINDEELKGTMEKSPIDNSYAVDIGKRVEDDAVINVEISFTGYKFKQELVNTSKDFVVDKNAALSQANKELKEDIKNILSDKNNKIEVVMKILKDSSSAEINRYYWYVGVIATNGETLGILIDANSGEIIAKKV